MAFLSDIGLLDRGVMLGINKDIFEVKEWGSDSFVIKSVVL